MMARMARLEGGRLSEAWRGEAADFTPLLNEQLDVLGELLGLDLDAGGQSEVHTVGGRRIDIVASGGEGDGSEFVIENQYGRADHDHLTRGLAYAVARRAKGLIVVAEEHRDEFRAVAEYLNELAEHDPVRGIPVWLVEAKAVRIGDSPWAPLFSVVAKPNRFTAAIEQSRPRQESTFSATADDFAALIDDGAVRQAAHTIVRDWRSPGRRWRLTKGTAVLEAAGPAKGGWHVVVSIYPDGKVLVPFKSYAGGNTGIPIDELTTLEFRAHADRLFGFMGSEQLAYSAVGWLTPERVDSLQEFCERVASAFGAAAVQLASGTTQTTKATDEAND